MSRRRTRRKAKRGGFRVLVGLVIALSGALAIRCRPDRLLEDLSAPAKTTTSAPAKTTTPLTSRKPAPSVHLEMGTPEDKNPADDHLMIKAQYALSYNRDKYIANWVSWNLNASYFGDEPRHKGKFLTDSSLPEGFYRVRHDDYTGSGFDRGHMVRSEERTRTREDNKATFLMTNILPQTHDLNAGPWLRLEEYAQELAQKEGRELYIMAGGIFSNDKSVKTIGKGVAVPDSFFKVVVVLKRNQGADDVREDTRVIAVVMPNKRGIMEDEWGRYRSTVDEIERRTGYDFLSALPESIQAALESRKDVMKAP